jgi:cell division protein FtsW
MRIDYRTYRTDAFVWSAVAIVGLLLLLVPIFGTEVNGAKRWIRAPGMTIQPSELAKLACIMFTALILERRMHRIDDIGYSLLPIGIVSGAAFGLILSEPDFGTALSLALIVGVMVFAAGLHYKYLVSALLAAVPLLFLAVQLWPYRAKRWTAFLDPWADPLRAGYQIIQSLIAVGTGGVFGRGLTQGVQKSSFLPEPHNDFIYAVIGEELGLVGSSAMIVCFLVIAWRGLRIATRAEDRFGAFVAIGITTMICAQALVNMSVVLGLLPTKGIPLPLVSYGGSSLIVSLVAIGVLLNISQHQTAES